MEVRKISLFVILLGFISKAIFAQNIGDLKLEFYSKLRDRRCTTMTLDKCDCPDAREMKAYIEALIEAGVSKEDIFYKVAKKFSLNTILDAQIRADVQNRLIKKVGEKRPQIILEPDYFNFGQVSKKQGKITKVFKLHNKGNIDLIINNIKASCACATVSLKVDNNKSPYFGTGGANPEWKVVVGPGQTAELETVLDLNHSSVKIGKLIREFFIISNDPLYPEVSVKIEAEVEN